MKETVTNHGKWKVSNAEMSMRKNSNKAKMNKVSKKLIWVYRFLVCSSFAIHVVYTYHKHVHSIRQNQTNKHIQTRKDPVSLCTDIGIAHILSPLSSNPIPPNFRWSTSVTEIHERLIIFPTLQPVSRSWQPFGSRKKT